MYVTRRLLRSTMPAESTPEKEEPFLPPPTPKRRAAVRATAKICEVVADASGPAARARATKTSPKQTENGGDEKNKSRNQKKTKKKEGKQLEAKKEEESPAVDVSALHGYQLMVDVHYRGEQFAEARILDLDPNKELLFVHYMGWNARFDAWVSLEEVEAHGRHTGVVKKKNASWDGETSLFATPEEVAAQRQNGKPTTKTSKTKKRPAMSPKARQAARKALPSASSDRKRHSDEVTDTEEAQPPAKRVVRKTPKSVKAAKKPTTKSPRSGKKGSMKSASSPARRAPRRVQVAVGTTDEDSERKNDSETADLVLDVEIEGREASNDEAEEDIVDEEEAEEEEETSSGRTKKRTAKSKSKTRNKEMPVESKRKRESNGEDVEEITTTIGVKRSPANKSKKPKKPATSSKAAGKPAANVKTASLPPQSGRGGLGSATREKLAAIFRLRVQQRQQMEQMNASQASFQQSLEDETEETTAVTATDATSTSAGTADSKNDNIAVVNAELAAAEEYQLQLQQYYYHQQVMLANSLAMSVSGSEDPSTIPLQGGIMDPRIIQERLTALEERRRQQAHVQAYYQQLMLTRERNVRALAANQAFMAASAAVWEQQLRETQSEDGTSSVTSWKDVAGADSSDTGKTEPSDEAAGGATEGKNDSTKQSETSSAAAVATGLTSSDVTRATSPDTVEKAAEGSETSPAKSVSDKCDPAAATPGESVLYEFVL